MYVSFVLAVPLYDHYAFPSVSLVVTLSCITADVPLQTLSSNWRIDGLWWHLMCMQPQVLRGLHSNRSLPPTFRTHGSRIKVPVVANADGDNPVYVQALKR